MSYIPVRNALNRMQNEGLIKFLDILRKGVTIYVDVGMLSRHFEKGIKWLKNGKVSTAPLISHRYMLGEAAEAF